MSAYDRVIRGSSVLGRRIQVRADVVRERVLSSFCGEFHALLAGHRYRIDFPFRVGELSYATDGATLVRTELESCVEEGDVRVPDMELTWSCYWSVSCEWKPFELPAIDNLTEHVDGVSCPLCGDRRVSLGEKYPEFGPNGEPVDHKLSVYGYDVDDNSIRDKSCQLCEGLAYRGPNAVRVRGVPMSYSRLKTIASIGNVEIASTAVSRTHHWILFRGNGFEGIALGLDV